ncbi:MAG TPA: amidohydrolase [Flavisolibacter sp.]
MFNILLFGALLVLFGSCKNTSKADLLVYNAKIYTVDSAFSVAEAMVVKDGKIVATGTSAELQEKYDAKQKLDARGKFIYPGLIDAHAHFYRYGLGLRIVDLTGTTSWEDVLNRLGAAEKNFPPGAWLTGRGWDQNDWTDKEFPTKDLLDQRFPNTPVLLTRVDGHAAIVNQKAIDLAGLRPGQTLVGGEVQVRNGQLTGILIDNAVGLVASKIPEAGNKERQEALLDAQQNCFAVGLTTVDDCGIDFPEVNLIDSLQKANLLKMRLYVMLSDDPRNYAFLEEKGIIKTDRLNVRSFKLYGDGALGSRGACLLQPYSDKQGHYGFLLSPASHFDSMAARIHKGGFQMCTHAIGDSANRTILNTYAKYLKGKNDLRWRIEHAQVVSAADFNFFGQYSVIPSVQPTHATSDMYWAGQRLGAEREKGAYAFKQLMQQNGWIPLGTDFPVEDISPFKTFFAAVIRKDAQGTPAGGYQPENALSRQDALRGMTIWAARSNFEEKEKGSLEAGKFADFIMLDQDLLSAPEDRLLGISVLQTWINGEKVYEKKGASR